MSQSKSVLTKFCLSNLTHPALSSEIKVDEGVIMTAIITISTSLGLSLIVSIPHALLSIILKHQDKYYPHFADEESKNQRD